MKTILSQWQTESGLVAFYNIRPGKGVNLFLQPWSPHRAGSSYQSHIVLMTSTCIRQTHSSGRRGQICACRWNQFLGLWTVSCVWLGGTHGWPMSWTINNKQHESNDNMNYTLSPRSDCRDNDAFLLLTTSHLGLNRNQTKVCLHF